MDSTGKVANAAEPHRVDLRGLRPGGPGWVEACATVAASMEEFSCVVVAHDALDSELRRNLFSRAMPEVFALPLVVKQRTTLDRHGGYVGPIPEKAPRYESLRISEATDTGKVDAFTSLLWPHGNIVFRDTIEAFAKGMFELEQAVQKMVLEGLGVQKEHVDSYLASLVYFIRLIHFGAPPPSAGSGDNESMYVVAHTDSTVVTTIAQHEVEGLEVVTNGRVPACVHRVRTPSKRERLSVFFGSEPKRGAVLSTLEELVDHSAGNPLRFRPCDFNEYVKFRFSQERPALYKYVGEFCGIGPTM